MDINALRSLTTVLSFAAFIGIAWWAYSRRNSGRFDEASQLPFGPEEAPHPQKHTEDTK